MATAACFILILFTMRSSERVISTGVRRGGSSAEGSGDNSQLLSIQQSLESIRASLGAVADGRVKVDSLTDISASRRDVQQVLAQLGTFLRQGSPAAAAGSAGAGALTPAERYGECLSMANIAGPDMDPLPKDAGPLLATQAYTRVAIGGWRTVGIDPDESFRIVQHTEKEHYEFYLFWARASYGQWEPQTTSMIRELFNKDTLYIDFGTWIGPTVLYASRKAGEVWGIEADPAAYGEASRNIIANAADMTNVHLRRACISDSNKHNVPFYSYKDPGDSMAGLLWKAEGGGNNKQLAKHTWYVDCYTLQDFVRNNNIRLAGRPVFVKIDTEGGEAIILQTPGIKQWLKDNKVNLFLSIHIDHVAGSLGKPGAYPEAGKKAIADVLAMYPFVYDDNHFQGGAIKKTYEEYVSGICGGCTYLAMWNAPPAGFVESMGELEKKDAAVLKQRQLDWDASHPN
jgi:FkbM family methyltransferase